jgi:uncharacterized protein (DUF305 family)
MRTSAVAAAAALTLLPLIGAACSSDDDSTVSSATSETTNGEDEHNAADVDFATMMIPHHEQAIEMAQLADDRAESEEVLDLAEQIEAAQAPEIEQLNSWLESWGEDGPDHGMDHDSGAGGMMSDEDMEMLEMASGAEFDRMFLEMMIEHHEGAIEMARTEVEDGAFPDAIAMAEDIVSAQQEEVEAMKAILAE